MATIKSQIKRIKTNEAARLRNKSPKNALRTAVRRVNEAVAAGDTAKAAAALTDAGRNLVTAASAGVIHRNQGANRKSALAKRVSAL